MLAIDLAAFSASAALTLLAASLALKLLGSVLLAVGTVRLFTIGHDACHGSYFSSQILNGIVGRIAFLPSMTAYSLWDLGHNVAHHGFNNLKGRDLVWTPYSKQEFDGLTTRRRILERVYRSGLGWGLYYFLELWWRKLYFASRAEIGSSRIKYKLDSLLVTLCAASWIGIVALVAQRTDQSFWLLMLLAIVVPFALWNITIGFVVYVHHTHPAIPWFQKRQEWQRSRAYLTSTAAVRLPFGIDRLMHNIMEHNAHHLNPRIPMFALRGAQRFLREQITETLPSYRLDWRSFRDCVRSCKLYDYNNHAWLDWHGVVTARVAVATAQPS